MSAGSRQVSWDRRLKLSGDASVTMVKFISYSPAQFNSKVNYVDYTIVISIALLLNSINTEYNCWVNDPLPFLRLFLVMW